MKIHKFPIFEDDEGMDRFGVRILTNLQKNNEHSYTIRKYKNGVYYSFGTWNEDEVIKVRKWLCECGFPVMYSVQETRLRGGKYKKFLWGKICGERS